MKADDARQYMTEKKCATSARKGYLMVNPILKLHGVFGLEDKLIVTWLRKAVGYCWRENFGHTVLTSLWTCQIVADLIKDGFGIRLSLTSVDNLLHRLGQRG
jgi:hypothetical protein